MIKESNTVKYKIIIYIAYNQGNLDRNIDKTSIKMVIFSLEGGPFTYNTIRYLRKLFAVISVNRIVTLVIVYIVHLSGFGNK